jgi:hypothetical protein
MYHEKFSLEWPSMAIRFLGGVYFVTGAIDRQSEAYLALESLVILEKYSRARRPESRTTAWTA